MIRFAKNILAAGLDGLVLGLLALPVTAAQPAVLPAHLPLYFEANQGQANAPAQFIARGQNYQFLIAPAEAQIALRKTAAESVTVRMQFVGANPQAPIRGDAELPGKINYLTGDNPAQWRTGLAMFAKVRVEGLYPGVNLVYYGNQQRLEYDFAIAPNVDPGVIAIHFDGTDIISVTAQGELILKLSGGEIRQPKPVIYQTLGGARKEIEGGYRLVNPHTVAFAIGQYDHSQLLVIDPVLGYSTYFGGTAGDTAWAVALDTNGSIYIAGETFSQKFFTNGWSRGPAFSTFGAYQTNYHGGTFAGDAFVAKLDVSPGGINVDYLTYLGGSGSDTAYGLAVDSAGNAYVAGGTVSTNFPIKNAIPGHTNIGGVLDKIIKLYPSDAFVAELDASGSNLVYSTYLGGSGADTAYGVAVDSAGHAFVTGFTFSTNFPTTTNAMFRHLQCTNSFYFNCNAFVTEVASNGGALVYSSYFGGTNYDIGKGIAVDSSNCVYVTGFTASTNFPNINSFQSFLNGSTNKTKTPSFDAFVAKFDPTGTNLVYSTFLGGTNNDAATHIAVDNTGAAYVTGWTVSTNFPNTIGTNIPGLHSFVATNTSLSVLATNVFLTKIITTNNSTSTNAVIAWSAVFGGKGVDVGNGVAVDPAWGVFVTGSASSTNFPTSNVPGYLRATNSGKSDAFIIAFNTIGSNLLYSTYLGGKDNDYGYGIAVATNGDAYVVGQTLSTNFPTLIADYPSRNGSNDAFLTKITMTPTQPVITDQGGTNWVVSAGSYLTMSVTATGMPILTYQWQKIGTNLTDIVGTNVVDGVDISGATNSTLIFSNPQKTNSGNYMVIVTNYAGAVTSSVVYVLWVTNIPPVITDQPTSQTVAVGSTVKFSIDGTPGTLPFFLQWQKDGTNLVNGGRIGGATNVTLTITNAQTSDNGGYSAIVTNPWGSVTSSVAILTVASSPVIVVQPTPTNQALAVGSNATFAVTAVGIVPLSYQWRVNGTNLVNGSQISGATTTNLTIINAQTNNSGNYTVIVTNLSGSATSSNAVLTVTNVPPKITTQPTSQTVAVGSNVTLVVTATGTAPLSYQWQTNGMNLVNGGRISGATNATLTITDAQLTDSESYTVIVMNIADSVTSSNAALTVTAQPVITVPPTNQTVNLGTTVYFMVTAVGTAPLSYQWQTNGINLVNGGRISGATTTNLTISTVQTNDSGDYSVIVTNVVGSVTSSPAAVLTVLSSPVILVQPTNQSVAVGATATFVVTAIGVAPLSYQWLKNGAPLANYGEYSGVITSQLTITGAQTNNSDIYAVVITNSLGSVTSSNAVLTVTNVPPAITVQPTNQTVEVGATATLAVTATGTEPLSYQWWLNETNLLVDGGQIEGATSNVLTISNLQLTNNGIYTVIVTNVAGSVTSSNAVLMVTNVPPAIVVQPTNQTVGVGSTVILAVTATGTEPLSYQWQVDGTNLLVDGGQIEGATSNVLTISNVQLTNNGNYTVIVTNVAGSVTSSNAVLTVALPLSFGSIIASGDGGGGFILSGTGGVTNGTYYVLTSSNLLLPLTNWTSIATDQFDSAGNFIFTNAAQTNAPQLFYLLQLP